MVCADQLGMRVLVVGASTSRTFVQALIDAGAEVHCIDSEPPSATWIGSHTECDLADSAALVAAVERVGPVLHAVYLPADMLEEPLQAVTSAARSKSVDGIFEVIRLDAP